MLSIVCYALDARGATIEEVTVEYPDRELVRPDLSTREKSVAHDRVESIVGVDFDPEEVVDLFERSGLDAETEKEGDTLVYEVDVPSYRVDVLHPLDLVDDVGRAYGFNDLDPRYPDVSTVGGRHERSQLEDAVRNLLVGLGFEDLLNFHMISEAENYGRMLSENPEISDAVADVLPAEEAHAIREEGLSAAEVFDLAHATDDTAALVEDTIDLLSESYGYDVGERLGFDVPATIREPYSEDYTMLRTWALPSLLMVLENNTHRSYPQDLAEIGLAAHVDDSENTGVAERRTVAGVLARHDASYEDAKARLQALARNFDVDLETPPTDHPTFVDGRTADVVIDGESVGVIGEVHPAVLVEHDLELPVAGFEFRMDALE
jgi:phenylalanyl-tRNA synthetase beta chain